MKDTLYQDLSQVFVRLLEFWDQQNPTCNPGKFGELLTSNFTSDSCALILAEY